MKTKKGICQYLAENDYAGFLQFVRSDRVFGVTDEEAVDFYQQADELWALALLQHQSPTPCIERVIIKYYDKSIVLTLYRLWKFFPGTIEWAFEQEDDSITEKVLNCLEDKCQRPSAEAEVAFIKHGNTELFKDYLEKFGELSEEAEKLLNEDGTLSPMLSIYVDFMTTNS